MSLNTRRIVILLLGIFPAAALLMVADQERRRHTSPEKMTQARIAALVTEDSAACIECHATKSPGVVEKWKHSKHAEKGIGCNKCHEADRDDVTAWDHEGSFVPSIVTPKPARSASPFRTPSSPPATTARRG